MQPANRLRVYVLCCVVTAVIGIGAVFGFVATHRSSAPVSEDAAESEFHQLRVRFGGQRPILDMEQRQARPIPATATHSPQLHTVHTAIFDTRERPRLVRIDVPYWLARA